METDGELAQWFLVKTGEALGRRLVASARTVTPFLARLRRAGVAPAEIRRTVEWLTGPNLEREFAFEVQSGRALFEKWDRIQFAMAADRRAEGPREENERDERVLAWVNRIFAQIAHHKGQDVGELYAQCRAEVGERGEGLVRRYVKTRREKR